MKPEIIYLPLSEIKPYENNPRYNESAVDAVAQSIKEFGFKNPIILDKHKVIIAGHTRYKASQQLGLEEVPCIIASDLTNQQAKAYRLVDNKVGELAEWDFIKLSAEIEALPDFSAEEFGFDMREIDTALNKGKEAVEDDYEEPDYIEPRIKRGEVWQLGNHRLMCGDSTKEEDVDKLMNGNKADMVFTDPPYGMKKEADGVLNDNLNYDDLLEFNKKWIPLTFANTKENGSWYCWGIDEPLMDIYSNILKPMIRKQKLTFRNLLTWDKNNGQGQNTELLRMYATVDEKCLFCMCGVQGFNENSDTYYQKSEPIRKYLENKTKKVGLTSVKLKEICGVGMYSHWFTKSQFQLIPKEHYKKIQNYYNGGAFTKEYGEIKKEYYSTRAYFNNTHDNMNNVWHFDKTAKNERESAGGHATPKPIALCSRAIKSSSRENENVLDVFGGSGSTLIACEQLNRYCYMMELDEKYASVIIDRWEKFTGQVAKKIC